MRDLPLPPDSTYRSASPGQTVFGGRYRLERLLARGEGDMEWLAKDRQSKRRVTLRFLPTSAGLGEEAARKLSRKVHDNWGLDHSSINRDLSFHREGNLDALVSDYREGFTLTRERLTRPLRVFEPSELEDWVEVVCSALDQACSRGGLPHGDLKPGCLLQAKKGERIIMRWGLAAYLSQRSDHAAARSVLEGSLAYSSPQRLAGMPASFADDFYAFGATLFELITGLPPFHEGDLESQILNEVPPSMEERRLEARQAGDDIPKGWEAAVAACLAKEAGDRPRSGEEFLAYLDGSHPGRVEAGQVPAPAKPIPKPEKSSTVAQRTKPLPDRKASLADETSPASDSAPLEKPASASASRPAYRSIKPDTESEQGYGSEPQYKSRKSRRETKFLQLAFILILVGFSAAYYFLSWLPEQNRRQALSESVEAQSRRVEEARLAREAAEAEILRLEQEANELLEAEQLEAERREAERLEAERLAAERLEAERLAAEQREAERLEAERLESERQAQERETLAVVDSAVEESQTPAIEPVSPEALPGAARLVVEKGAGQHPAAARLSLRSLELEGEAPPVELEAEDSLEADSLPVGRYRATASREGWPTLTWEFELEADEVVERIFDLSDASVYLTSDPEGAEVWESDRKLGETPLSLEGLAPGPVQFELRRRFHENVTVSGDVAAGEKVNLSAQLVGMEGPPDRVWERDVPGVGIPKIWIQPGSFVMGSPPDEEGRRDDESARQVTLDKGFWIGLHEVTQDEWQAVMRGNPSLFKSGGGRLPVDTVSWNETQEFCRRLNQQARREGRLVEGYEYRLPTEAEWEFAARAGTEGRFAGDDLEALAWYAENSGHRSREVGVREPNAWGLFDMHGNLSEWCHDWYGPYPQQGETNPTGPTSGDTRVFRGGNWGSQADFCRSAKRGSARPDERFHFLGLRVVLAPIL